MNTWCACTIMNYISLTDLCSYISMTHAIIDACFSEVHKLCPNPCKLPIGSILIHQWCLSKWTKWNLSAIWLFCNFIQFA